MSCPKKPDIKNPCSVWESLQANDSKYTEMAELLKETIEDYKTDLSETDLSRARLGGAYLTAADLDGAEQICVSKSLWKAKNIDPILLEEIKETCPHLLEEPKRETKMNIKKAGN